VEREHRRAGIPGEALARGEQGARDAVPARVRVDGQCAPAGPAGRPAEPLDRDVRVERPEPADPAAGLDHEQAPVPGVLVQVEHVGQVRREDVPRDQLGVLAVRRDDDVADRRVVGWHRVTDERRAWAPGRGRRHGRVGN
jgi:hypothetical protein